MAGSTFQPPIHLDPSQDAPQQTAFTNQNFQSIASTLETNSFRIVLSGSTTIVPLASTNSWVTIPHNLGYAPVPFVYLNNVGRTVGGQSITNNGNFGFPTFLATSLDTVNQVVKISAMMDAFADTQNLYIFTYNAQSTPFPTLTVQYYLVQQPAN